AAGSFGPSRSARGLCWQRKIGLLWACSQFTHASDTLASQFLSHPNRTTSTRAKTHRLQSRPGLLACQETTERNDGGPVQAGTRHGEVVLLLLQRQEPQSSDASDRLQGGTPVRPSPGPPPPHRPLWPRLPPIAPP